MNRTPRLKSNMPHGYGSVPTVQQRRSTFRRDHKHKTTLDVGYLVPIFIDEVLPGDTYNVNLTIIGRLSTPLVPIMDNLHIDTHAWFVPNRLLWENWERFCGAQDNPGDSTDFVVPRISCPDDGWAHNSLPAYFGVRQNTENLDINALYTRAYNFIYNECYRDQDLQDSIPFDTDDGPDDPADYPLRKRAKRPDYFTTCRPFLQKGPAVEIPLGDTAPVIGNGLAMGMTDGDGNFYAAGSSGAGTGDWREGRYGEELPHTDTSSALLSGNTLGLTTDALLSGVVADLSSATASTVNALRFAFQMQRKFERDARSGTRHTEFLNAHWGVNSPDFRLQRPEYLGGGSQRMEFQTVPNFNISEGTNGAELGSFAVSTGSGHGFLKSFVDYGVILVLAHVRADQSYQQGVPRLLSRETIDDYYLPVFQNIGEQPVLNREIFATGDDEIDNAVFGYQEYGADYRYGYTKITGKFNSEDPQSLDFWHLGYDFEDTPILGDEFIQDDPPIQRALIVEDEPHVIMDTYSLVKCTRTMPVHSVPGMIDHF